jgi:hypothetical protein
MDAGSGAGQPLLERLRQEGASAHGQEIARSPAFDPPAANVAIAMLARPQVARAVLRSRRRVKGDGRVRREERPCEFCGEGFVPRRSDARFCSTTCRQRAHRRRRTEVATSTPPRAATRAPSKLKRPNAQVDRRLGRGPAPDGRPGPSPPCQRRSLLGGGVDAEVGTLIVCRSRRRVKGGGEVPPFASGRRGYPRPGPNRRSGQGPYYGPTAGGRGGRRSGWKRRSGASSASRGGATLPPS